MGSAMSPRPPYVSAAPFMLRSLPGAALAERPGSLSGAVAERPGSPGVRSVGGLGGARSPPSQKISGDVDGLGEPDVLLAEHLLDQPLEHAHARGPAHHLWMEHQVVEAAFLVLALELL